MSGLKKIKFSYPYAKLYDLDSKVYAYSPIARATLLGVFEVKLEDLHKSFLRKYEYYFDSVGEEFEIVIEEAK